MSDFLTRLAERALGLAAVIEPRSIGLFTPVDEGTDSWRADVSAQSPARGSELAHPPIGPPAMPSASAFGAQDTPAALQLLRPDDGGAGSQIHVPVVRAHAIEAPPDGASTASDRVSSASRAASRSDRSSVDDIAPTADAVRVAANAATRPAEGAGVGQRRSEPRADRVLRLSTAQPVSGVPAAPLHPSIVAAAGAARDGAPETRLEITIGRIDVRAPEPRSMEGQRARRRRDETGLSLSDYLRGTRRPRGGT